MVSMKQINLLKTTDLPLNEQINFIKMGYGDLLQHPSASIKSVSLVKERINLDLESKDQMKASEITFKLICFKTPQANLDSVPMRFYF